MHFVGPAEGNVSTMTVPEFDRCTSAPQLELPYVTLVPVCYAGAPPAMPQSLRSVPVALFQQVEWPAVVEPGPVTSPPAAGLSQMEALPPVANGSHPACGVPVGGML